MTLCDTGPLVALVDADDPHHEICVTAAAALPAAALLTTWPCFTEAMYLLGKSGGFHAQAKLWAFHARGGMNFHDTRQHEILRMRLLMETYVDAPMDFADASLVAAAETLRVRRIFTLDRHFHAYRANRNYFHVVP